MKRSCFEIVSGWVEGVGSPPSQIPVQGHIELAAPFPRVRTNYGAIGFGYARVWRSPEGCQLTAIGAQSLVTLNGAPVHHATLTHGDVLTWGDVTLRFLEVEEPEHREPRIEAAIAATPDDEGCWQVYADWLLSHGDPLGERIRGMRPGDAEFLGQLEPLVTEHGALTLEWSHGFIRSAVLRSWGLVQVDELLLWLLQLPVARFLRSLEIELRSFMSRQDGRLPVVLEQVQRVLKDAPLPALEHLALGPLFVPIDRSLLQVVRPEHAPRLAAPGPDGYLQLRSEGFLEIERGLEGGPRRALHSEERVQLYETPSTLVGSIYWDEGWSLFSAATEAQSKRLKVNGKQPTTWQPLREGDLIESGDWLRMRFRT